MELENDPFEGIPRELIIPIDPPINEGPPGHRVISQLVLREPKEAEVRRADQHTEKYPAYQVPMRALRVKELYLVSYVSGVPVPVIEQLGISRIVLAIDYLNRFLVSGRQTGAS
jgi:hypothetical protein